MKGTGAKTLVAVPSERPKSAGRPCLVVMQGPNLGQRIDLDNESVEIGRSEDCAVSIDSDLVSRRHAVIQRILGKYTVADLGSTNGTFVNGKRVKTQLLTDGDTIAAGKTVLRFTESYVELQYHEQLFTMASQDALTGVFNKRYFDEALAREFSNCAQSATPLALLLFDIDFFKRINDTYGHPAGDEVLRCVTSRVHALLASTDILARVGGEEFAVILPGGTAETALAKAELVRAGIAATAFSDNTVTIPVTISVGVALSGGLGETPLELYQRADKKLYEAKHSGRNRVAA